MSAAKMVADSTQSDLPEKSTRKRKKIVEKKREKKKKISGKKSKKKQQQAEDEYDENDLDLDVEIQPISYFVKNRPALVEQLFHCVRGTSLQRALPDVLTELPFEELKQRCLEQLEVMSKKRIRRIIAGDDPASISSSGTEDEESTEEEMEEQVEEEYVEDDDEEMQMADSTSQPAPEMEYSDREEGDQEELSDGSHSPTPSADGEQQPSQSTDGDTIHSTDPAAMSIAQQNIELQRKLEEEHRNYKLHLQSYKAKQQRKTEEEEMQMQGEEAISGDVSNQDADSKDSNDQLAQAVEKQSVETFVVAEEGEVVEQKQEHSENDMEDKFDNSEMKDGRVSCNKEDNSKSDIESDLKISVVKEEQADSESSESTEVKTETDDQGGIDKSQEDTSDKTEKTVEQEEEDSGLDTEGNKIEHKETESRNGSVVETQIDEAVEKAGKEEEIEQESDDDDKDDADEGEVNSESEKEEEEEDTEPQDVSKSLTQNQMELLELEMRARAIKAMLKMAK